jgi:hypothetical protein
MLYGVTKLVELLNLQAMQSHPSPVPRPMIAIPADLELIQHMLKQPRAIKVLRGGNVF